MSVVPDEVVIATLRAVPEGQLATMSGLRAEIGCGQRDLQVAVRRLRNLGKIAWDRLELSASLLEAAPAPATIAEQVKAEAKETAKRRTRARSVGTVRRTLDKRRVSPAEAIASAFLDEPHDAIAHVKRAWPPLWARVLAIGREMDCLPGVALFRALEAGLDCMEDEG